MVTPSSGTPSALQHANEGLNMISAWHQQPSSATLGRENQWRLSAVLELDRYAWFARLLCIIRHGLVAESHAVIGTAFAHALLLVEHLYSITHRCPRGGIYPRFLSRLASC